jgi:hypothetical protein
MEWFPVNRILALLLELPVEIESEPSGRPAVTRIPVTGWA